MMACSSPMRFLLCPLLWPTELVTAAVALLLLAQLQGGESLRLCLSMGFQGSQQEHWEVRELKDRLASRSDEEPFTCGAEVRQ